MQISQKHKQACLVLVSDCEYPDVLPWSEAPFLGTMQLNNCSCGALPPLGMPSNSSATCWSDISMEWYHISDILQYIRSEPRSGGSSNPPFSWEHISVVQCPMLCSWHDCPGTFDYPNVFVRRALAEEEIAYGRRDQKQWEAAVQDGNRRWMVDTSWEI